MPYIPHTKEEIQTMLSTIGAPSVDSLFSHIPKELRITEPLNIPPAMPEPELLKHLKTLAAKNQCDDDVLSFLGGGAYRHFIPAAVTEISGRSEFLTPYTHYQPEISQGTLQATFEFQSMMCRIFNMEISNASLYDGSTALGEAALMSLRIHRNRKTILLCETVHPEYREVLRTLLGDHAKLVVLPSEQGCFNRAALKDVLNDQVAAVIAQLPNFFGIIEDLEDIAHLAHNAGALFITSTPEALSLGMITPPGDLHADIAVGEGLSFGIPLSFGGPALGIFTTREKYLRTMPGRLCGETVDADGRRSYVLTLSTREQFIRREKATSNICTNQTHCATTAAIYLSLIGKEGFQELALANAAKASYAREQFSHIPGIKIPFKASCFNEFVMELPKNAEEVLASLRKRKIHGGISLERHYPSLKNCILVCCTEKSTKEMIDQYAEELRAIITSL